jgi:phospholipid/cholesterol/gamma-HCH transport system substrate-binding protein
LAGSVRAQTPAAQDAAKGLAEDVLNLLCADPASRAGLAQALEEKIRPFVDLDRVSRSAIERSGLQMTPEQRRALTEQLRALLTRSYGAALAAYDQVRGNSSPGANDSYQVVAEFDDIGGLRPRAPVRVAGVVVGRVEDVALDPEKFVARVSMRLDKRYRFPKDTGAAIVTAGLLGEQYVALDAGVDGETLADGSRLLRTQPALVLEKVLGRVLFGVTNAAGAAPPPAQDVPGPQSKPEGEAAPIR